jgi:hypothetical protein
MNESAKLVQWLQQQPRSWQRNCASTRIILRIGLLDEILQKDPSDPKTAQEIRAIIEEALGVTPVV